MEKNKFRNIAIIAHVDHGKTTLVDGLLKQGGVFASHQTVEKRVMDSMDLEKERGITITAKNTSVFYNNIKINIIDTPGHADFGGEVERGLSLVDGVLLLVDASEGPLPQTRFVLKKSLEKKLRVILVINKIDRSDSRINEVINEVYDMFIDLGASDEQIDFPIIYTNAKAGTATLNLDEVSDNLDSLFELIIKTFPGPDVIDDHIPQFLISNLDYDSYVGQVAIGRLQNGVLAMNTFYSLCSKNKTISNQKFSACYTFEGLKKIKVDSLEAGDIIALAGVDNIHIGDTISCNDSPIPLPRIEVDKPTVSMTFQVNDGPFSGRDGKYLTSRNLSDRFNKELLKNVSLRIKQTEDTNIFKVSGRGELQMAVLIETMRREGYEFLVSKPRVITQKKDGKIFEPFEKVYLDIKEEHVGVVTEKLSVRKGKMLNLQNNGFGRVLLEFLVPSRGLIGFRGHFIVDTNGSGIMNSLFDSYDGWKGSIPQRNSGVIVADRRGKVTGYACLALEDRGILFCSPGDEVYRGMVVGERNKRDDLEVNITREKKLTNMRASTSESTVLIKSPKKMTLDQCIEFISDDEFIEITPKNIYLRKMELDPNIRISKKRKEKLYNS